MEQARHMTPAEMREAAAVLVEALDDGDDHRDVTWSTLAREIRALPLAEEALTPREKLRRVREARELLATARVAFVPRGAGFVTNEATGDRIGDWGPRQPAVRTWVLDTLRAEGWDVVEEGEGDG